MDYVNIALFPIPNCVAFPGVDFPIHVFEPRYRTMVHYCLETNTPLAVCHTEKMIHAAKTDQTLQEALNHNQSTFQPTRIFSAGTCELIETLSDGRMHVVVHMNNRYQSMKEIQTLPFLIHECVSYDDLEPESHDDLNLTKQKVIKRLLAITSEIKEIQAILNSKKWQEKSPEKLSFELFEFLRFDANSLQTLLETRSAGARLHMVLDWLNQSQTK